MRSRLRKYVSALAAMAVAVGLRYALNPILGHELPFTPLLGAVARQAAPALRPGATKMAISASNRKLTR